MVSEITKLYCLTFPEGKQYIGITCLSMKARLSHHVRSKRGIVVHAIKKYGLPAISVLAVGQRDYISELERRAIIKYRTLVPNGYNLTKGGDGFSSQDMKERWSDPAFREKTTKAMKNGKPRGNNISNFKKFLADPDRVAIWKQRLSTAMKKRWADPEVRAAHGRKVRQTYANKN